jgi:PDZ domain-containing protein
MTRRASTLITGIIVLAAIVFLAVWAVPPVGYVALRPGPTFNTLGSYNGKELITITGTQTSKPTGELRMLTVSEYDQLSIWSVVSGWLDPNTAVVPSEIENPPGETQQQIDQQNTDDFKQSQSSAITAALRYEGYPVQIAVTSVDPKDPAYGHLQTGDLVTTVNGQKLLSIMDLDRAIQSQPVGTKLTFGYTRDGVDGTTEITTAKGSDDRPLIGIGVEQRQPAPPGKPTLDIKFQLDNVGGPSAGMMFTLGIIDKLSQTDLTGGRIVAGTGEIDDDGNVGIIGGIQQKMRGAYAAGARVFLAPAGNCAEALKSPVSGLELVKVSTLQDALDALQDLREGKTPPLCTN